MKNYIIKIATSGRLMLTLLGFTLALGAVSCKTAVTTDKPAGTASQSSATNQPVTQADPGKPGKASFYTCGMHTEVRSVDPDGKCPICQMSLLPAENVPVVDPASGKTNTAASFPVISGYYSCPMHPEALSKDPAGKCPICDMPLSPVEDPVFIRSK
jgi:hypothetical protein